MELNFDFANGLKDDRYFNAFLNIGQAIVDMEMGKKRFVLQVKLGDSIVKPQRKDGKLLKWKDVVEIIEGYKQCLKCRLQDLNQCNNLTRMNNYYTRNAKIENKNWELSKEQANKFFNDKCHYCGKPKILDKYKPRGYRARTDVVKKKATNFNKR